MNKKIVLTGEFESSRKFKFDSNKKSKILIKVKKLLTKRVKKNENI